MIKNFKFLKSSFCLLLLLCSVVGCTVPNESAKGQSSITVKRPATGVTEAVESNETDKHFLKAKVLKITDGDTLKISIDGKTETCRLLLVDTPESVHPDIPEPQPFAIEASNYAKKILNNKDVQIELDVSERDKYGRLLVYLYVNGKMFNEMLLEKGYARVAYIYPPNTKYVDQFREIQKTAQKQELGIWGIENYASEDGYNKEIKENTAASSGKLVTPQNKVKETPQPTEIYYKNCAAVRAAGAAPIRSADPGYGPHLDGDADGIACE